jgi:hypothetical protein
MGTKKDRVLWEETRPQMWCLPDHPISRRGRKEIVSPIWVSPYAPERAVAVRYDTLCPVAHIFLYRGVR